jgi:tubulin polyglutamylase TTLL9
MPQGSTGADEHNVALQVKNLKRAKKQLEREDRASEAANYDFFPITYILPNEYQMFVEEFKRNSNSTWIAKPVGKAQGRGIFLFNDLRDIKSWKQAHDQRGHRDKDKPEVEVEVYVAQKYIENPYLVGGKKFDLRLYALVTSYSPLTIWFYRSGFARFSAHRFTMNKGGLGSLAVHLTNVAVQKTEHGYDKDAGCKWDLKQLKMYMMSRHGTDKVNTLFYEIQMIIVRSLLAVQKVMMNDKHCFELYGYDVMIDDDLKPWLIEVNASPSLSADTQADHDLKVMPSREFAHVSSAAGDATPRCLNLHGPSVETLA